LPTQVEESTEMHIQVNQDMGERPHSF